MDVLMPQLGETVAEGKILAWFKSVGDELQQGDAIFEVETDKVSMEVEAISSGLLSQILVQAGDVVKVGTVVAVIGGDKVASAPAKADAPVATAASPVEVTARSPFEEVATPLDNFGPSKGPSGLRITPLARRLIAQNGLDINAIERDANGRGDLKVTKRDIVALLHNRTAEPVVARTAPVPVERPADGEVFALNTIRQRVGERLAQNWQTIPHVFQGIDVDFTNVEAVRSVHKAKFKTDNGLSLTYLPFIARATCLALQEFPQVNAQFDGQSLVLSREVNFGIAVDLSHDGLVVPVVRNADELTVAGIAKAIGRQVAKARAGKLSADDMSGGTYSISNNGSFGTTFTVPIINAPQIAILSIDAIRKKPAVVQTDAGEFIAPRLIGTVGQSFDHRAFDGAYSAAFLSRLKTTIEQRDWMTEFK